ncbi:MAG: class I SAM-dependent methyltransferase, partial [Pseudorhizobium sp.]
RRDGKRLPETLACRLCSSTDLRPMEGSPARPYWHCQRCDTVFVDQAALPGPVLEHAHYCRHENDPADPQYRRFLARLGQPLLERLTPQSSGLDYGCGPGPGLAAMFREAGHEVALFDPFFAPDRSVLGAQYDYILCCEVAEHFHQPGEQFARLTSLIKPGGWIGIMTCFRDRERSFEGWHYRRDPTHVVFYTKDSFEWISRQHGLAIEIPRKNVVLLHKPRAERAVQ